MNNLPFNREGEGRLFRGNLHTHTTASDGAWSPERVCAAYREQGYDFVAITDHFMEEYGYPVTDTRAFRTAEFTTIIGAELHAPALANGQVWHIVAAGLPLDFPGLGEGETGAEVAERAHAAGAFLGLAHPAWYGATVADLQSIPHAHAVEVYNYVCAVLNDKAESWFHADQLLAAGRRVTAFGADDAHFRDFRAMTGKDESEIAIDPGAAAHPAGFAAWVWVQAERLDPDLLVESLKAGRYYTSQRPEILDLSFSADKSELTVVNSPATSVYVTGDPGIMYFGAVHGEHITSTTFRIAPLHGSYCRVTVVDAAGKRAWSNPIWLD